MIKCKVCDKPLTNDELKECFYLCFDCDINYIVGRIANHLQMARLTFEELIRKVLNEVDR